MHILYFEICKIFTPKFIILLEYLFDPLLHSSQTARRATTTIFNDFLLSQACDQFEPRQMTLRVLAIAQSQRFSMCIISI